MRYTITEKRNGIAQQPTHYKSFDMLPSGGVFNSIREVIDLPHFTSGTFNFSRAGASYEITVIKSATDAERKQNEIDRKARKNNLENMREKAVITASMRLGQIS